MAKALVGHFASDARLFSEVVRLRARVRELESELIELRAVEALRLGSVQCVDDLIVTSDVIEIECATPALT